MTGHIGFLVEECIRHLYYWHCEYYEILYHFRFCFDDKTWTKPFEIFYNGPIVQRWHNTVSLTSFRIKQYLKLLWSIPGLFLHYFALYHFHLENMYLLCGLTEEVEIRKWFQDWLKKVCSIFFIFGSRVFYIVKSY